MRLVPLVSFIAIALNYKCDGAGDSEIEEECKIKNCGCITNKHYHEEKKEFEGKNSHCFDAIKRLTL